MQNVLFLKLRSGRKGLEKGRNVQRTLFLLPSQAWLTYQRPKPGLNTSLSYRIIILATAGKQRQLRRKCAMLSIAVPACISSYPLSERWKKISLFFCDLPIMLLLTFWQHLPTSSTSNPPPPKLSLPEARAPHHPQGGSWSSCTEQEGFVLLKGIYRSLETSWFWPKHKRSRL